MIEQFLSRDEGKTLEFKRELAVNTFFDEQPCTEANSEEIDFRAASGFFDQVSLKLTPAKRHSLNLLVDFLDQAEINA